MKKNSITKYCPVYCKYLSYFALHIDFGYQELLYMFIVYYHSSLYFTYIITILTTDHLSGYCYYPHFRYMESNAQRS